MFNVGMFGDESRTDLYVVSSIRLYKAMYYILCVIWGCLLHCPTGEFFGMICIPKALI